MAYSHTTLDQSNIIPFPVPVRSCGKDHLIQEIAEILNSAESRTEAYAEDRLADRLERVAERLERIVQHAYV